MAWAINAGRLSLLMAIAIWPLTAQKGPAPGGGTAPAPGAGSVGSPNKNTGIGNTVPTYPDLTRGIYLSGQVMLEDGTPPPESVTIERVCGSSPRAEGYTDGKGRFSLQLDMDPGVLQDASETGAVGPGTSHASTQTMTGAAPTPLNSDYRLMNCDLRASLPGYRSDTVSLSGRRVFDNPDVGTIFLHRLANVEGTVISATSLAAPKDARKAYEKAREEIKKEKLAEAEKNLQKAVELYPKYAAAWYELGRLQQHTSRGEMARLSYRQAIATDPKFISPYLLLTEMAALAQKWQEMADYSSRALRLDAVDYPQLFLYNSMANYNLGHLEAAEKTALEGKKLDTAHRYPRLEEVLGMVAARRQDYAAATEHLRAYLESAPPDQEQRLKKEIAEFERLAGTNQQATTSAAPLKDAPATGDAPAPRR